jgi:hypothetical protein
MAQCADPIALELASAASMFDQWCAHNDRSSPVPVLVHSAHECLVLTAACHRNMTEVRFWGTRL